MPQPYRPAQPMLTTKTLHSCASLPRTALTHCTSSITNWIGVVPCLSGFLVIISCALYCRRNRCTNITEGDSTGEMLKRPHLKLWLVECTLKERVSRAQQPPLTLKICLIVPVIKEKHEILIILQAALSEISIDVPKQEVSPW